MVIRILLAEGHRVVREGLRLIVDGAGDMRVVASVGDGETALQEIRKRQPSIVLVDVALPILNGIELARRTCGELFSPRFLCLAARSDSRLLAAALASGASGYILKEHTGEELIRAVHIIYEGGTYLSPLVTNEVVAGYVEYHKERSGASTLMQLTARERQVLQLTAEGFDSRTVGTRLGVSAKTVYTHLDHIMQKLSVRGVADLTRFAVREGVTAL